MTEAATILSSADLLPEVQYPPPPTLADELAKALEDPPRAKPARKARKPRGQR